MRTSSLRTEFFFFFSLSAETGNSSFFKILRYAYFFAAHRILLFFSLSRNWQFIILQNSEVCVLLRCAQNSFFFFFHSRQKVAIHHSSKFWGMRTSSLRTGFFFFSLSVETGNSSWRSYSIFFKILGCAYFF